VLSSIGVPSMNGETGARSLQPQQIAGANGVGRLDMTRIASWLEIREVYECPGLQTLTTRTSADASC